MAKITAVEAEPVKTVSPYTNPNQELRYKLYTIGILLAIVAAWEMAPRLGLVSPIILPSFSAVIGALITLLQQDFFLRHFTVTLTEIVIGFILGTAIGLSIGIALAVWPTAKRIAYPLVVGFQAIPKIVFAPLFIAWFGFGMSSKVVMAVVISFFPVLINTLVGLESVPEDARRLMRSIKATPLQTFRKVSLPHALPVIFAGIKAALTFAVIGAIVGEFVGASEGLGYLVELYKNQLRIDRVFAVIVILATIGAGGYFLLEWLDRKLIFWRDDSESK
ncbi:NitT/TauT family transport system permease protein [Roseinatronobacter thiooxidans]|uniref:NitT/TauT family transport system permease protein n=1 Tax=Roseinatronobacter thiooxidans TaxID=121821 RepID=A0A2W7PKG3_9RHOB|nr:ABC transporter permease [Roseinatronobacter thiooxidans]PZX36764.1 NitT/TauT family transport system permease protein [Roseinatronobacter thiooxidans]